MDTEVKRSVRKTQETLKEAEDEFESGQESAQLEIERAARNQSPNMF